MYNICTWTVLSFQRFRQHSVCRLNFCGSWCNSSFVVLFFRTTHPTTTTTTTHKPWVVNPGLCYSNWVELWRKVCLWPNVLFHEYERCNVEQQIISIQRSHQHCLFHSKLAQNGSLDLLCFFLTELHTQRQRQPRRLNRESSSRVFFSIAEIDHVKWKANFR